jgi:hypothetical protein
MRFNESIVADSALEWFRQLGYATGHGPQLSPCESATDWVSCSDVVLVGLLREAIWRMIPATPPRGLPSLRGKLLPKLLSVGFLLS